MCTIASRPLSLPPAIVRLLVERAQLLARRGLHDQARALYASAIAADPTPVARIAFAIWIAESDAPLAIAELETAWDEARRIGHPSLRGLCCQNLSLLCQRVGDDVEATRFQQLAIAAEMESAEFNETAMLSAPLLSDVAARWMTAHEHDAAGALLRAVTTIALDDSQRAIIASHRGVLAIENGEPIEALRLLLQASRLFRQAGDITGAAHTLVNLGHLLQLQRRFAEARHAFTLAAALSDEVGDASSAESARGFAGEVAAIQRLEATDPHWN